MSESEKKSDAELLVLLTLAPREGTPWRHYKGGLYWIRGSAIAEASQTPLVIYHQQSSGLHFARPLSEWRELVEWQGQMVPRFEEVAR